MYTVYTRRNVKNCPQMTQINTDVALAICVICVICGEKEKKPDQLFLYSAINITDIIVN